MNEQLRKAIEEATRVYPCGYNVDLHDHKISQAKLMRVIELLVQQRDDLYELFDVVTPSLKSLDAELIAALESEGEVEK